MHEQNQRHLARGHELLDSNWPSKKWETYVKIHSHAQPNTSR
jgi:hypothetical protein